MAQLGTPKLQYFHKYSQVFNVVPCVSGDGQSLLPSTPSDGSESARIAVHSKR